MAAYTLRPAGTADAEFLFSVYAQTRTEELAVTGWSASQIEAFLRAQFVARDTHYRRLFPAACSQIVQVQGEDAGGLLVERAADTIYLVDVALLPGHRGQGVGTALLRGLQCEAAQTRRAVALHVELHNRARALYRRLGFAETQEQGLHVAMHWRSPPARRETAVPELELDR